MASDYGGGAYHNMFDPFGLFRPQDPAPVARKVATTPAPAPAAPAAPAAPSQTMERFNGLYNQGTAMKNPYMDMATGQMSEMAQANISGQQQTAQRAYRPMARHMAAQAASRGMDPNAVRVNMGSNASAQMANIGAQGSQNAYNQGAGFEQNRLNYLGGLVAQQGGHELGQGNLALGRDSLAANTAHQTAQMDFQNRNLGFLQAQAEHEAQMEPWRIGAQAVGGIFGLAAGR